MDVFSSFSFDAAHQLPHVPEGHKCARLHGHTFSVQVHVSGPVDPFYGWVIDFDVIKKNVQPLIDQLDHHYLNEIPGLENPTSENIALWLWVRLKTNIPQLSRIIVQESPRNGVVYAG
jgi:6-pyruvoyltetrahydropterin/6-carboxytetrahydropterin synthase